MIAGLSVVLFLSPFFPMIAGNFMGGTIVMMKKTIDVGAWGLLANVVAFVVVTKTGRATT